MNRWKKGIVALLFLLLLRFAIGPSPVDAGSLEEMFIRQREEMVKEQIEKRGVKNPRVLAALQAVPRHRFVPELLHDIAYSDGPLPIGEGQTISQPYIVAFMTELADIQPGEKVLEVGTGSGYQAAVLAELTSEVYTIEILPGLAARAKANLESTGYAQVKTRVGDGYLGWPEAAPFDAILVTAAADHVPQPLIDQLAERGVLVIPVGKAGGLQELQRLRKRKGKMTTEKILPVVFVPLKHES